MKTESFYNLSSPDSDSKLAEWAHGEVMTEKVICPANPGHRRGGKRLSDLTVTLPGGKVEDFVWTWHSECLMQDHVLSVFRNESITGFDVKPVTARFKRDGEEKPPTLWELVVTGWAGMAAPESGIRRTSHCEHCLKTKYTIPTHPEHLVDEDRWDGSDLFIVWPMPMFILATQRVVDVIRNNQLTGVKIIPLHEIKMVSGTIGIGGGQLSYWMPEHLAHQRGEAAGIEEI